MNATWPHFSAWLLHSAAGGGILLLLALPLLRMCRQPAWRQRVGESAVLAALVLCLLNLGPSWITLPLLNPEPSSPPLAPRQPAENSTLAESKISESAGEARQDRNDPATLDNAANALALSLLEVVALDADPTSSGAADELAPSGSPAADPDPGPTFAWASLNLPRWLSLLALVYVAASAFLLGRWLLGHWALWRLLRDAQPAPEAIYQVFETMTRGAKCRPRLLVSRRLRVPLSCGVLRPCVVVPASFCQSNAALRWLFAHELTHLERGDAWTCLLFGLGQTLYFFLPWFWWLRRQVRLCQEYIADAAAAEQAANPEDYAQFLVSLTQAPAVPLGALGVFGNSSDLFRRVTMLLQNPMRVERCCPRWWSLATAGGLLALALFVSGVSLRADSAAVRPDTEVVTVVVDQEEPAEKPEPGDAQKPIRVRKVVVEEDEKQPAEKKDTKKSAMEKVLRDLDELLKDLPSALDADQVKRLQEQLGKTQRDVEQAMERLKKEVDSGKLKILRERLYELKPSDLLQNEGLRHKLEEVLRPGSELLLEGDAAEKLSEALGHDVLARPTGGRLGVQLQKPNAVLADQLDLPKGQGLVIERVVPNSAADKGGLKAHDILLEINGKPVPNDAAKFIKMLNEVKANTPFDAVVLRKGKKETIKGLSLAEAKNRRQLQLQIAPGQGAAPLVNPRPNIVIEGVGGQGRRGVITTMMRTRESFTTRHQEGSLIITVTGSVTDGKSKVKQIQIQDGGKSEIYESLEKVPEAYRDKVKNLIEMSEKHNIKIEVGADAQNRNNSTTITLEKGSAATLAQVLDRMLPQLRKNPVKLILPGRESIRSGGSANGNLLGNPNTLITLTAVGNKLIATCEDPQVLNLVRELSRLLMLSEPAEGDFEVIQLKHADAAAAAKILDEAFNGNKPAKEGDIWWTQQNRAKATIRVVADPTTNSILIQAKPLDMLTIRKMVEEFIDKNEVNGKLIPKNWKIGPLKRTNAKDVYDLIRDIYKEQIKNTLDNVIKHNAARNIWSAMNLNADQNRQPRGRDLTVTYDVASNSVFLNCNEMLYEEIAELIAGIEKDSDFIQVVPGVPGTSLQLAR